MTLNALGLIALGAGVPFDGEDPLAGLGVPPEASARVRELVIKGLLYEMAESERWAAETRRRASKSERRRGRPKRVLLGTDAHRALYIIHRTGHFEGPQGEDVAFIRDAMASEAQRRALGLVEPANLIWGTDEGTLAKSVSKGRKELAERAKAEDMTVEEWLASLLPENHDDAPI